MRFAVAHVLFDGSLFMGDNNAGTVERPAPHSSDGARDRLVSGALVPHPRVSTLVPIVVAARPSRDAGYLDSRAAHG